MAAEGMRTAHEVMPLARAEAEQVLQIDRGDCRGHGLFGVIAAFYDYDWAAAETAFRTALLRQPPAEVHMWYEACFCLPQGLFREGAAHTRIALASDPLNPMWRSIAAEAYSFGGMYDDAATELRRALEADENHWHVHLVFSHMYAAQGKLEDALASAATAYHLAPWESRVAGTYAGLLARTGRGDESNRIAGRLAGVNSMGMVLFGALMNKPERAAEWYEKAINNREPLAVVYARNPVFASLHRSPFWPRLALAMRLRPQLAEH
jgi:Tfp pilus assembly protein PilF